MTDILRLSPEAVQQCTRACDEYVDNLRVIRENSHDIIDPGSFGTLPSGRTLAAKFTTVVAGTPHSLSEVLDQHIAAITALKESFIQAGRNYLDTETTTTAALTALGESHR